MKNLKKLTLLHSNDLHGDFLAEQVDDRLIGGASMLSGYVSKVRAEEPNVIYAIAGDMFRGSVIDSEYKGLSTIEIMNMLAPDIVTIGNHEIDYGISHLLFIEKCAKFPIINANLHITTTGARLFSSCKTLERGGMKILFIGIITEEVMAQAKQDSLIGTFIDTKEAAKEVGVICNSYKKTDIDFTVLLTHIGHEEDKLLASRLDPEWGVDVIIGGHSHTFLDQPVLVNGILVAQAGTGTDQIGRFDIMVDTDKNCVDSWSWTSVPIDSAHCPRDEQLENIINRYKQQTDQKYSRVVTRFRRSLTHPQRNQETPLGNLFADVFKDSLGVDIMMLGSGSIRSADLGPIVDYGNLCETFPYDDSIYQIKVTGAMFKRVAAHLLRDEAFLGHTEFYQLSKGVAIKYSKSKKQVLSVEFDGKPLEDDRVLTIGLQQFHFSNLEPFLGLTRAEVDAVGKPRVVSTSCLDILMEYLDSHPLLDSEISGRIEIVE